jgi:hypothetical protein
VPVRHEFDPNAGRAFWKRIRSFRGIRSRQILACSAGSWNPLQGKELETSIIILIFVRRARHLRFAWVIYCRKSLPRSSFGPSRAGIPTMDHCSIWPRRPAPDQRHSGRRGGAVERRPDLRTLPGYQRMAMLSELSKDLGSGSVTDRVTGVKCSSNPESYETLSRAPLNSLSERTPPCLSARDLIRKDILNRVVNYSCVAIFAVVTLR